MFSNEMKIVLKMKWIDKYDHISSPDHIFTWSSVKLFAIAFVFDLQFAELLLGCAYVFLKTLCYSVWSFGFFSGYRLMSLTWIHEYTVSCVLLSKMLTGVVMIFLYFPTSIVCMSSTYVKMKKKKQHNTNTRRSSATTTETPSKCVHIPVHVRFFLFVSLLCSDPIQCRLAVYTLCSPYACMYVLAA